MIKEGFNESNKQNTEDQIIAADKRQFLFRNRDLNLEQLAREGQYKQETIRVLNLLNKEGLSPNLQNLSSTITFQSS